MFKCCSSMAFLATLGLGCGGKIGTDSGNSGVAIGGGNNPATGGAGNSTVVANAGGTGGTSTTATAPDNGNLSDLTQDEWDQINNESCSGWTAEGESVPANIEFLVDTSGSMGDVDSNNTDGRSNWAITKSAIQDAFDKLPRLTSVGMLLWPNKRTIPNAYTAPYQETGGIDACVNVAATVPPAQLGALGSSQRNALVNALDAVVPQGGTPMNDAYNYATDNTFGNPLIPGVRYVVLVTDGRPTIQLGCEGAGDESGTLDYQPVLDSIEGAYAGTPVVRTFVVGTPGSENLTFAGGDSRVWLSEAAQEGGTQLTPDCENSGPNYCHFDMSGATGVATGFIAALQTVTGAIMPCTYTIDASGLQGQVVDPNKINVIYEINGSTELGNMRLVGPASSSSCPEGNGWHFDPTDATGHTIQLCPTTCDMIHQDPGAVVVIRGGCEPIATTN